MARLLQPRNFVLCAEREALLLDRQPNSDSSHDIASFSLCVFANAQMIIKNDEATGANGDEMQITANIHGGRQFKFATVTAQMSLIYGCRSR